MTKKNMEMLKKDYNAWLVVKVEEPQDWNAVVLNKYLVFTDSGVLELEEDSFTAKEPKGLFVYYPKLKEVLEKLEGERKEKFEKIFAEIEKEWKEYAEATQPKSFKVISK